MQRIKRSFKTVEAIHHELKVDFPRFSGHQLKSLLLDFYMFSQIPPGFYSQVLNAA